ncbi:MAG: dihydrolipoamide acetyltransferase family protein, partial [Anaerolineae bacterium]
VPVGTPIAVIGTADEDIDIPEAPVAGAGAGHGEPGAAAPAPAEAAPAWAPGAPAPQAPGADGRAGPGPAPEERVRSSPLARRLAAEAGLDVARLAPGSGPRGRVVRDDVVAATADTLSPAQTPSQGALVPGATGAHAPDQTGAGGASGRAARREALSPIRRTIARRLSESWRAAPHIFVRIAVDMDAALALRSQINEVVGETGPRVSVNDVVVKATARALADEPAMNSSWHDGERVVHGAVNVGVAVALDDGLITITVADADLKTVTEIAREVRGKADRARAGKMTAGDLAVASTFTISNMGMFGIEEFTAILNPPEAGILAVGAAAPEAVVRDGKITVRRVMRLTLAADHRVVDGAVAALFLARLKQLLENPAAALA